MYIGLGLPGRQLSPENIRFARQAGATHLMISLHGYGEKTEEFPYGDPRGLGETAPRPEIWSAEALGQLRSDVEKEGLRLQALENFEPADWYDVLLDGPLRAQQIAGLQDIIRNVGKAGIPTLGYNFSLAAVWGRQYRPVARGGAMAPVYDSPEQSPIPRGMVWNSIYDRELFTPGGEPLEPISAEELWRRYERFLDDMLPVAEEAGVTLALHPDDPPAPELRGTPRLVHSAKLYDRVLDYSPSDSNGLEFCIGTLSEMPDSDIYEVVDHYSRRGRIAYAHMRNVSGTMPYYEERFIDEGDTDMLRIMRILGDNGYEGMIIPDHAPMMSCPAPWHAGVAHALGWMSAGLRAQGLLTED